MTHNAVLITKQPTMVSRLESHSTLFATAQAVVMIAAAAAFFLPVLIAEISSSLYYVSGIDLIFGKQVSGDKYGMIPQTTVALAGLALVLGMLSLFIRNRDKASFVPTLCSLTALTMMLTILFESNTKVARLDPVVAAMVANRFQYGYYIILALLLFSVAVGILSIISRPGMRSDLVKHRWIYLMALPVLIYVLIFFYYPMYGTILAFKDYIPRLGILGSPWAGLKHFETFFNSVYFGRLIRNTLAISGMTLLFGFFAPIIFALFLNEVQSNKFKRFVQTATYLPHFISLVVICGLLATFLQKEGIVNQLLIGMGMAADQAQNYLSNPDYFWAIYVISGIWQTFGWGSIVYFAAITNIDPQLYEAADLDGANRFRKMWNVTIPGIAPTIIVMFIMAVGGLMSVGHEKTILLYSSQTYVTADIVSSYVYRMGIVENNYSFATAVGLFNTAINFVLVTITNRISRRVSETSLW